MNDNTLPIFVVVVKAHPILEKSIIYSTAFVQWQLKAAKFHNSKIVYLINSQSAPKWTFCRTGKDREWDPGCAHLGRKE